MSDPAKISLDLDFGAMTGSQLVTTFNNLAAMAALYGLPAKPVKRFADSETGRQRCERLRLEVRDASATQPDVVPEQLRQDTLAIQQAAMEEARPHQPEEESEMAAAKKAAPKTRTPKAEGAVRGFPDHAVIKILAKENPRRGAAAERFELYKDGMTVKQYTAKIGSRAEALVHLRWDVNKGHISLKWSILALS